MADTIEWGGTPGPWYIDEDTDLSISGEDPHGDSVTGYVALTSDTPGLGIAVIDMGRPNVWNDELLDLHVRAVSEVPALIRTIQEARKRLAEIADSSDVATAETIARIDAIVGRIKEPASA